MAIFLNNPRFIGFTTVGAVATNGYIGVFEPGTTTPKVTYSDPELTSANATTSLDGVSVVRLDADGGKWLFFTGKAKVRLYNSNGVQQWEKDNIQLSPDDSAEWINEKTATYGSATTFTLAGDNTTEYHVGRRVQLIGDTMGTAYATITVTSYVAPTTTVTISVDAGDSIDNTLTTSYTGINSAINESIDYSAIAGITPSADEINILDGVTATAAELNKTDDSAAAVSGYVSGMRTYINTDGGNTFANRFDLDANVTENSFESIGPTGSGATNIWAVMDIIPAGARIAIMKGWMRTTVNATGVCLQEIFCRQTGSSATAIDQAEPIRNTGYGGAGDTVDQLRTFFAPLDSSRRADFTWNAGNDSARDFGLYLVGFIL